MPSSETKQASKIGRYEIGLNVYAYRQLLVILNCFHFLKASGYIYIAGWGMTPGVELVRGTDHRAGPDGSPEQEALLAALRAEDLSEADIAKLLSCRPGTVKSLASRALTRLRKEIEP